MPQFRLPALALAFALALGAGAALADAPPSAPIFYCPALKQLACPTPGAGGGASPIVSHRARHGLPRRRVVIAHAARHRHMARAVEEAEVSSSQADMYRYEMTHSGFASKTTERVVETRETIPPMPQHFEEGQSWDATMLTGHGGVLFEESETERSSRQTYRSSSSSSSASYSATTVGVRRVDGGRVVYTYAGRDDFGYLVWPGKTMNLPGH
jgi:hypothetical protein